MVTQINKEVLDMPKIRCIACGRTYHGWALKYKECSCDYCGQILNRMANGKSVIEREHTDKVSKIDILYKGRDYNSSVKEVNEGGVNDD